VLCVEVLFYDVLLSHLMVHVIEDANLLQLLVNLLLPGRALCLQDTQQGNLFSSTYDGKFFVIPLQVFPASTLPPPPPPPSGHGEKAHEQRCGRVFSIEC
jgi:hypothetical protein